ncbi:MAG: ATP-binding protein [Fibrobacteria bacterium]|nr:ATP-binding protein [Fibrobacteria bacterium]
MEKFSGRKAEVHRFTDFLKEEHSSISVVYGRRRIGKSFLVAHCLRNHNPITIEGLENKPQNEQIKSFLLQLARQCSQNLSIPFGIKSWAEALFVLFEELKNNPRPVILDEFQWLANYRSDLVVQLKMLWEQYISKCGNIKLVLCGSIASFMIKRVIKSQALYGRVNLIIHLKAMLLKETSEMMSGKGLHEILDIQLLTGGVPKYIQMLQAKPSVRLGIVQEALSQNGYFVDEFDRIFTSHFGKNPDYEKIIHFLAMNPYGLSRTRICEFTGIRNGGNLTTMLDNLDSAGFISSKTPFFARHSIKQKKYYLHDAYLRFFYSFIKPNLSDIERNTNKQYIEQIWSSPRFRSWMGKSFEHICIQHAHLITELLGFAGVEYACGPYFKIADKEEMGCQIDLAFDRADKVITLCEMKYTMTSVGMDVIEEVERKSEILRRKYPAKTIQPVLLTLSKPTSDLENSGYFFRIIQAETLIQTTGN